MSSSLRNVARGLEPPSPEFRPPRGQFACSSGGMYAEQASIGLVGEICTQSAQNAALGVAPGTQGAPESRWITDTGATSHMTPHRHWIRDFVPYVVPIRLANNQIVHSTGVGSVLFNPVIAGRSCHPVVLSRVLHVPALQNNLHAVLHLCKI